MGDYFNRGASAGGHDEGYFNRPDVTGPAGVGSATGGPGGVAEDDLDQGPDNTVIERDKDNPNIVRAVPAPNSPSAGQTSPGEITGTYPAIVEGSDSETTGTSWGLPPEEEADEGET